MILYVSEGPCGNADREVRCEAVGYKIMIQCDARREETKPDGRGMYSTMYVDVRKQKKTIMRDSDVDRLQRAQERPGPGQEPQGPNGERRYDTTAPEPGRQDERESEGKRERARTSTRGRNAQSDDVDESRELLGLGHPPAQHAS